MPALSLMTLSEIGHHKPRGRWRQSPFPAGGRWGQSPRAWRRGQSRGDGDSHRFTSRTSRVRGSSPSRMAVTGRWIHLDRRYSHRAGSKREFSSARLPSPGAHPGRRQSARFAASRDRRLNSQASREDGDSHLFAALGGGLGVGSHLRKTGTVAGRRGTARLAVETGTVTFSGAGDGDSHLFVETGTRGGRRGQSPFVETGTRGEKSVASPLLQTRGDYKARDLRTTRRRACSPVTSGAS